MNWTLPGTILDVPRADADKTVDLLSPMFLAGGMMLSQVTSITGLESHVIQNWVKRKFLSPPLNKRYDMEQVCRILNINLLRGALPLERICDLMAYINGDLTDESDDLVNDTDLYFMFVRLAARARDHSHREQWDEAIEQVLSRHPDTVPGAKDRIRNVLRIMITAWIAGRLRQSAENMLSELS